MTKQKFSKNYTYFIVGALLTCFFFSPVCIKFFVASHGETWLSFVRPLLVCLCLTSGILLIRNKAISISLLSFFMLLTLTELVMVCAFGVYMNRDHFMALITTTPEESTAFATNNLDALWYLIPAFVFFTGICVFYAMSAIATFAVRCKTFAVCLSLMILGLMPYENMGKITSWYTFKAQIFYSTLEVPPLNIVHLTKITVRQLYRSAQSNDFEFHSTRSKNVEGKETYVLSIGESVRYANFALNGRYQRNTTPLIGAQDNIIFFQDYYTGGCATSISVPIIISRATADNNPILHMEKSIVQPFKENGFTTIVIKRGLFAQPSSAYLYRGADYAIDVSSDAEVFEKIDSVSQLYDKTFIMFQLTGSHCYYDNFPKEFDKWHPNNKFDKHVESDSLLINAYDNTILYTDYLLNNLVDTLKQRGKSALWYVSDHGETITATKGWHGAICDTNEYHVPFLIWYSDSYGEQNSEKIDMLKKHAAMPTHAENIFYTICGMTDIVLPPEYQRTEWDISSDLYQVHPRKIFVNGESRLLE